LEQERIKFDGRLQHHEHVTKELKDQMVAHKEAFQELCASMKSTKVSLASRHCNLPGTNAWKACQWDLSISHPCTFAGESPALCEFHPVGA